MDKELQQLMKEMKKGEKSPFALSDFCALGEDLFLIKTIGDQLMLYTDIISECDAGKKEIFIPMSSETLWGIGQMLKNLTGKIDETIAFLDHNFDLIMCGDEASEKEKKI